MCLASTWHLPDVAAGSALATALKLVASRDVDLNTDEGEDLVVSAFAFEGGSSVNLMGHVRSKEIEELHLLISQHLRCAAVPGYVIESVERSLEKALRSEPNFNSHLLQRFHQLASQHVEPKAAECKKACFADNTSGHAAASLPTLLFRRSWALVLLGVLTLSMVFAPCVAYSEWYIDELFAAVRNADARGDTPLLELLRHDFWGNSLQGGWTHKSYRPLVVLSYVAQYWLNSWDFKPQPLRAFNVAVHAANSILLVLVLRRLKVAPCPAFLAAALFAVHPVHAENAIYLVGRADSMATCCWLVACLSWNPLQRRGIVSHTWRVSLVTVLAVLGGFCKESGFCVLLHLAVVELLGPRPLSGALPLVGAFCAVFLGRNWITSGTSAGFSFVDAPVQYRSDLFVRSATYLYFHAKYAQLMVFPWVLSWDYSYNALPDLAGTWQDLRMLAILAAYLSLLSLAAWAFAKRKRLVLIGLSNMIIPFVPASNLFFVVGVTVGERLLYPCNIGAAIVIGAMCTPGKVPEMHTEGAVVQRPVEGHAKFRWFKMLLAAMLIVFAVLARMRTYQWSSRELLFGADAKNYPQSTKARHQFGTLGMGMTVLHKMERFDEALFHFEAAEQIYDGTGLTQYCIGQILLETGRAREAEEKFQKILSGHALGFSLVLQQRFAEAVDPIKEGLRRNEDVPYGLNALGYSYLNVGKMQEALEALELGLKYDPTNAYLENNLGVANIYSGQLNEGAIRIARSAQLEPGVAAFAHNVVLLREMADTGKWPAKQFALELFYNRGMLQEAVAGGICCQIGPGTYIAMCGLHMLSTMGRCFTFNESGDGYARGEGCGLLYLKADVSEPLLTVKGSD
eukprot:s2296_g5.t1